MRDSLSKRWHHQKPCGCQKIRPRYFPRQVVKKPHPRKLSSSYPSLSFFFSALAGAVLEERKKKRQAKLTVFTTICKWIWNREKQKYISRNSLKCHCEDRGGSGGSWKEMYSSESVFSLTFFLNLHSSPISIIFIPIFYVLKKNRFSEKLSILLKVIQNWDSNRIFWC